MQVFVIYCNKKFATFEFQQNEKNEYGKEIYLWYYETLKSWRLSFGSSFEARNDRCWMHIVSPGKQEFWIHLQWIFIILI